MSDRNGPGSSYTVLRIKRKATEPPLASLVIQGDTAASKHKRRKDEVDRARGIFRLADTVPDTWQGQGSEGDVLRRRIKGLLETRPEPQAARDQTKEQEQEAPGPVDPSQDDVPEAGPSRRTSVQAPLSQQQQLQQQYRIVRPPVSSNPNYGLPPRVITKAEMNAAAAALKFVDAEAVSSSDIPSRSDRPPAPQASPPITSEEEKEMAAFLPMLQEYLKVGDSTASNTRPDAPPAKVDPPSEEVEQYVYDLYYRDLRPSLSSTPLGLGVGDGMNIGALLGYPEDELESEGSASEPEDEADEDSNDEDYYRNDYPEDEDADEDMMGYKDAFGGQDADSDDGSDDSDWRRDGSNGMWEYR